ncbi:unnamed protein product [Peniophora sp. CBMAI 1063]|nr:unnamed protein product [Peniophora sp. CBMAI 1063]
MSALLDPWIPAGLLPKWQLLVGGLAFFNTAQNFLTLDFTRRLYNGAPANAPVTRLQARTFGIWTLTSGIVRCYAAYHMHDKKMYDLALCTYLLALCHFGSEIFVYRTARLFGPALSTIIVSSTSRLTPYHHPPQSFTSSGPDFLGLDDHAIRLLCQRPPLIHTQHYCD